MNSFGWYPELRMRWSWPSSSSREYFEISQNLSLTSVIVPLVFVVARMADWSSAYLTSVTVRAVRERSIDVRRSLTTIHAMAQTMASATARLKITVLVSSPIEASGRATMRKLATHAPYTASRSGPAYETIRSGTP